MSSAPPKTDKAEIDLMLKLSFLAYAGIYRLSPWGADRAVTKEVKKHAPTQTMAWGPKSSTSFLDLFTSTLAYITKDRDAEAAGESLYTVVIRGTNVLSWSTVLFQDLAVHDMTPWKLLSPNAEVPKDSDPAIYQGAGRTLDYLNALKSKGQTIIDFLADKVAHENARIRVTGHSLGGMAAMMYPVWIQDELTARGLDISGRLTVWPVAGITPGNRDFVDYTEALFAKNKNSYLRIVNDLDFATKAWLQDALSTEVPTMYAPEVTLSDFDRDIIELFYNISLNRGYQQPPNHMLVPSQLGPIKSWFLQFVYQHFVPYLEYLSNTEERDALLKMLGMEMGKRHPINTLRVTLATQKQEAIALAAETVEAAKKSGKAAAKKAGATPFAKAA